MATLVRGRSNRVTLATIFVLLCPSVAQAASPAKVASNKAVHRYVQVTHPKGRFTWASKCTKVPSWVYWHCTSQVWKGGYRAFYSIYVKGNRAIIRNERYVR